MGDSNTRPLPCEAIIRIRRERVRLGVDPQIRVPAAVFTIPQDSAQSQSGLRNGPWFKNEPGKRTDPFRANGRLNPYGVPVVTTSGMETKDLTRRIKALGLNHHLRAQKSDHGKVKVRWIAKKGAAPKFKYLSIAWEPENEGKILNAIRTIDQRLELETFTDVCDSLELALQEKSVHDVSWKAIASSWHVQENHQGQTLLKYEAWQKRLLNIVQDEEIDNGYKWMAAYVGQYARNLEPGSDARSRPLNYVNNLINHAIETVGLAENWRPKPGQMSRLIGKKRDNARTECLTPPIKDSELKYLLDSYHEFDRIGTTGQNYGPLKDRYVLLALMAYFGLMPAEIACIGRDLSGVPALVRKNNCPLPKNRKPRRLRAVPLPGREDEPIEILEGFLDGSLKLPQSVQNAIDKCFVIQPAGYKQVGDSIRQIFDRCPYWENVKAQYPDLTPYSARHSYAWRGHQDYGISQGDMAKMMGHSVFVHSQYYNSWYDEESLDQAIASKISKRQREDANGKEDRQVRFLRPQSGSDSVA